MVNYPASIDTTISLPLVVDLTTPVAAASINNLRTAILALENTLGVKPQSVYATVRARLDAIEDAVSSHTGGSVAILQNGTTIESDVRFINFVGSGVSVSPNINPNEVDVSVIASFVAGGDLTGSSTVQTVIAINGASVPSSGSLTTGNVLQVSGAAALSYGAVNLAGGANFVAGVLPVGNQAAQTLGSDLSGTTAAATVIKLHGATTPVAGSLTTGNVLQVSGSSALSYGAVNLAGGTNFVTGVLPAGNQAAQTLSGDLSGTTAAATVIKLQGNAVANTALTSTQDGYYLRWINSDGQWEAFKFPTGVAGDILSDNIIVSAGASGRYSDAQHIHQENAVAVLTNITSTQALGTSQPLSLADALFAGLSSGGSQVIPGTLGVLSSTFTSSGAETGTSVGQGGLGSSPASGQPYNSTDFPGLDKRGSRCRLALIDDSPILLGQLLSSASSTDSDATAYGYLSFRSDLGANAKWRLWFYYKRAADGYETPFTPDTTITGKIDIPQVVVQSAGTVNRYVREQLARHTIPSAILNQKTNLSITTKSSGSFTLALGDAFTYMRITAAGTITVPNSSSVAFLAPTVISGIGTVTTVTFAAAGGVTINKPASRSFNLTEAGSSFTLTYIGSNVWDLAGDLGT